MSHFTDISIEIRDIEALRKACADLGLSVLEQATARGYGENLIRGEYDRCNYTWIISIPAPTRDATATPSRRPNAWVSVP